MQDPLKTNKAFKESYMSYQHHKKYLTPYNVDALVSCLHRIKDENKAVCEHKHQRQNNLFVDSYMKTALPEVALDKHSTRDSTSFHRKDTTSLHYWKKLEPIQKTSQQSTPIVIKHSPLDVGITIQPIKKPTAVLTPGYSTGSRSNDDHTISCYSPIATSESRASMYSGDREDGDSGLNEDYCEEEEEEEDLLSDINEDLSINDSISWEESASFSDDRFEETIAFSPLPLPDVATKGLPSSLMIPPRSTYIGETGGMSPPLTRSLFPSYFPPTIHFPLPKENYEPFTHEVKRQLKWKPSTITPNVIKQLLNRIGFTYTNRSSEWIGYWGKHMKSEVFRSIQHHQKVNHLPGSFQLGRKDYLWRNMAKMQAYFGRKNFDFMPQTFILPREIKKLRQAWDEHDGHHRHKWIIKPPASARGIGIKVIHKWSQVPKKRPVIVQRYISNPYLINENKFDLRVYVYVTSIEPLTIYVYRNGLVRFATIRYSQAVKTLSNRFIHLTNYSVNKKSNEFLPNSDETQCVGHKWGLLALWDYMETHLKIDPRPVWDKIQDLVIKTILSSESHIASLVKANCPHSRSVHELFGFDIMLDSRHKPWLLEVNVSPSLHSNSSLDMNIKGQMLRDVLNMAGLYLPNNIEKYTLAGQKLSPLEKSKHSFYIRSHYLNERERKLILEDLTPNDCYTLMKFIDEDNRKGGFIRVYPTINTIGAYNSYFQQEKYSNILIEEWLKEYGQAYDMGVATLTTRTTRVSKHDIKK